MRGLAAGIIAAFILSSPAWAQFTVPDETAKPDGAALFANQCGVCHSFDPAEQRQGPTLKGVYDRKAGSVPGFAYSPGFAKADFNWDDAHLDAWLTSPQAVIPGAVMLYRQADPETRQTIIAYLKEQH